MPEISRFFGIVIFMFFDDHNPPHFHAHYNDCEGVIDIQSFEMLKGDLSSRTLKLVREWAQIHQKELMENWNSIVSSGKFFKVEPLS